MSAPSLLCHYYSPPSSRIRWSFPHMVHLCALCESSVSSRRLGVAIVQNEHKNQTLQVLQMQNHPAQDRLPLVLAAHKVQITKNSGRRQKGVMRVVPPSPPLLCPDEPGANRLLQAARRRPCLWVTRHPRGSWSTAPVDADTPTGNATRKKEENLRRQHTTPVAHE